MTRTDMPTWITEASEGGDCMLVRSYRLSVLRGVDQGLSECFDEARCIVGARPGCNLVLRDQKVSGYHFEITIEGDGYRLRDLGSTNGTLIGNVRVVDAFIAPDTEIRVGSTSILFETLDDSKPIDLAQRTQFGDLVGRSAVMRALFARLEKVATSEASALVHGETGSGKELVADAIHRASSRAGGPFVVVDCGAVSPQLIASELFGHEKGAFTGAGDRYVGAFERANGGTIFLDEIGELPLDLQPTLLGVLERRRLRRVGGSDDVAIDVRVIAATHRDLARDMNKGRFREDLYFRIAVVRLDVPPLRERLEDIPVLVPHLLEQIHGGERVVLKQKTLDKLGRHDFPGNVRELRNLLERAVALAGTEIKTFPGKTIPPRAHSEQDGNRFEVTVDATIPFKEAKGEMVGEFERRYAQELIELHRGNVSSAARAAGLDRMTVHKMLQRYGIEPR